MSEEDIEKMGMRLYKFLKEKSNGMKKDDIKKIITIVCYLFFSEWFSDS